MPKNNSKAERERRRADAQKRQAIRDQRTLVEHEQILWDREVLGHRTTGYRHISWRERRRLFGKKPLTSEKLWGVNFAGQVLQYVNEALARECAALWDAENPEEPRAILIPPTDQAVEA